MGIQATISRKALMEAGVEIKDRFENHEFTDPDTDMVVDRWVEHSVQLTFPDGHVHWVHGTESDDLWVDFNHWGNNRPLLKPRLEQLNITWREG
jgi:hypothetical protein